MRARALLLLASLAIIHPLSADWDASYAERLDGNLVYQRALSQLRQAELRAAQQRAVYVPYLGVRSANPSSPTGSSSIRLVDGVMQSAMLAAELRFENLLGADLTFTAPFALGGQTGSGAMAAAGFANPILTVSRRIVEESASAALRARAALVRAQGAVGDAAGAVRLGLVSDVLDAHRSARVVESHRRNLATLERLRELTHSETDAREVERRVLQARRAILQAESALEAIDAEVRANVQALYPEALERIALWVREMPRRGSAPPESAELQAERLELAAAERERALWFLPYLPNPTVSGSLTYDLEDGTVGWQLSLGFSTDLVDRGERAVASYLRREGAVLARLGLESATRSRERSVASAWTALEILDLDRQLQALDVEDARETARRWRELFERGFVTEESVVMEEIDLAVEELDAARIEHDYAKKQLELLGYYRSASGERER